MKLLVFDTETTGLPQSKHINQFTLHQWPYIVQFSYIIYDTSLNNIIEAKDYIVKIPESISIPEETIKFHGISNEISQNSGVPIYEILNEFSEHLKNVDKLIGHNIQFDLNMVKVELLRLINANSLVGKKLKQCKYDFHHLNNYPNVSCTLKESVKFCNIQLLDKNGKPYLKYPKLAELHEKLFDNVPNNLHNSFNDVLVTLRCFVKLNYNMDLFKECSSFIKYSNELGLC